MDKASSGRPHNGVILEASPLPRPPLVKLRASSVDGAYFHVDLDSQSREEKLVNGTETRVAYKSGGWRHPFLLYVDGVLDEGNLGAIARSAYFLGVDAIATPTRQSAPWSHIALKASAGAAEAIPIFAVKQPAAFLAESAREGWRIYASDAVPADEPLSDLSTSTPAKSDGSAEDGSSSIVFKHARHPKVLPVGHSPVASHPTILMMGAEGTGLRTSLLNQAHYIVGIRAGRDASEVGVDSLNVSAASALLCFEFLKRPAQQRNSAQSLF
ncbi:alpha/beta knot [Westerdykella ornata]|uniref:Alpha/beta knot n=1 Tax=Westerdykella ornata TaxID=318751 RepID=A0A6A6JE81_WESOR|nr:alpha/beta knot [Westerdykella ornata]KAF2274722.1 alpha/beta knot [Westerdykella ornata]